MTWTCGACQHAAPLTAFYVQLEDEFDYQCPSCKTMDNAYLKIPRIDLRDRRGELVRKFYIPTPKQCEMHLCTARNLLWGGRAGTGKSWALRHDAYMRCLTIPGYRVLLLRRQFTELRDTHLDKAPMEIEALTGDPRNWRASENTAVFPHPNGPPSRLRYGHCETDAAVSQYLSSEFDEIIYDEGSTFTEYAVRFINSRLRTAKKGVIPMVKIGSNPGAMWLYRYYIAKDVSAEDDPAYTPEDYVFIPATIDDNPHVNLEEQELRLNQLPSEALRKMYRDGDWLAVEGQFFHEWKPRVDPDFAAKHALEVGRSWHLIDELPEVDGRPIDEVPWIKVVATIDWGYDPDPGVMILWACLPSGRFIAFHEYTFKRTVVPVVAEECVERCKRYKVIERIGGHDMWMSDKQVGESMQETFARKGFSMRPADTDRLNGWQRLHTMLTTLVYEGNTPYPELQVYARGCPNLAKTFPMMQGDPKNIGDILEKDDHWVDNARWFSMSRPYRSNAPRKPSVWDKLPKDVRARVLGQSTRRVLGSESVQRRVA
jgi:hypothetical protein